jgi:hypothetical protein
LLRANDNLNTDYHVHFLIHCAKMEEKRMPSPDSTPETTARKRSVFARLAMPHSFNPDLGAGEALSAVAGTLARIFGACLLFALWGGFSAWVWTAIASHFWRIAALGPLVLVFFGAFAALMLAIAAVERAIAPRH